MKNTFLKNYISYNIHNEGAPTPLYPSELEECLKKLANKETYDECQLRTTEGNHNSYAPRALNSKLCEINHNKIIPFIFPALKRSFPNLNFRLSGNFIYGPGDFMCEHTNRDDPTKVLYLTYATGKSKFSYRFSLNDDFIDTHDALNGLTLRAFTVTGSEPFTFHKIECESGYRVSIGIRYVQL